MTISTVISYRLLPAPLFLPFLAYAQTFLMDFRSFAEFPRLIGNEVEMLIRNGAGTTDFVPLGTQTEIGFFRHTETVRCCTECFEGRAPFESRSGFMESRLRTVHPRFQAGNISGGKPLAEIAGCRTRLFQMDFRRAARRFHNLTHRLTIFHKACCTITTAQCYVLRFFVHDCEELLCSFCE